MINFKKLNGNINYLMIKKMNQIAHSVSYIFCLNIWLDLEI